jgi:hypothetical protein
MKDRIFISDWLKLKPYQTAEASDSYYLRLSNGVKEAVLNSDYTDFIKSNIPNVNLFSCFLTSYFEDIISETNIWKSFISMHRKMYGKFLPFYACDDYFEGEINQQDVAFLTWYYLALMNRNYFTSPLNSNIIGIAGLVMQNFDEAYEKAPENKQLKIHFSLTENEVDFYKVRTSISNILFKSYLLYPDNQQVLLDMQHEILAQPKEFKVLEMYLVDGHAGLTNSLQTSLLGLQGKEWLAEILGENHPLRQDVLDLSDRVSGFFYYKGQNEHAHILEHVATGIAFHVTNKSLELNAHQLKSNLIVYMGIVKWREEWWFSGVLFDAKHNDAVIKEEKENMASKFGPYFLAEKNQLIREVLDYKLKVFYQFSNGKDIVFLPKSQLKEFLNGLSKMHTESINHMKKGLFGLFSKPKNEAKSWDELNVNRQIDANKEEGLLVFFNPKSGIEVAEDVVSAFPFNHNPYYNEANSEEDFLSILNNKTISKELALFCLDNFKHKFSFLNKPDWHLILANLDFLMRFWKSDSYHTKLSPAVTIYLNSLND